MDYVPRESTLFAFRRKFCAYFDLFHLYAAAAIIQKLADTAVLWNGASTTPTAATDTAASKSASDAAENPPPNSVPANRKIGAIAARISPTFPFSTSF